MGEKLCTFYIFTGTKLNAFKKYSSNLYIFEIGLYLILNFEIENYPPFIYTYISCKNTFSVKKAWPSKAESYLEVNA